MRLGLVARAEDRGLGIQSWEFARAMAPERVLLIDMGELAGGFASHHERYPGATVVRYDRGQLPEGQVREWLAGLEAVFTVETFYDWRLPRWAEEAGAATVVQLNPEFMRPPEELPSRPTRWWAPTPWRLEFLPPETRVVPVPVADDRFPFHAPKGEGKLRALHVAGHRAMADRNGTQIVWQAAARMSGIRLTVTSQDDGRMGAPRPRDAEIVLRRGGVADYWRLYEDQDVLVMPRRYGGLCLPVQEAMASGLAVVMSDAEPQRSTWPVRLVRSSTGPPKHRCPGGRLALTNARPDALAVELNRLARDPEALADAQAASLAWAEAHRWSAMRALYEEEFADACAG